MYGVILGVSIQREHVNTSKESNSNEQHVSQNMNKRKLNTYNNVFTYRSYHIMILTQSYNQKGISTYLDCHTHTFRDG